MTKLEFIQKGLLVMNEASQVDIQATSFLGSDSANINKYFESSFDDAWRILAGIAPKSWLNNVSFKQYPIVPNLSQGKGYIILPKDFYMLASFKMQGWQKDIKNALIETDEVTARQANPYTQGSFVRPVATLSNETITPAIRVSYVGATLTTSASDFNDPFINLIYYCYADLKKYTIIDIVDDLITWDDGVLLPIGSILYKEIDEEYRITTGDPIDGVLEILYPTGDLGQALNYYTVQKGLASHIVEKALYIPIVTPLTLLTDADIINVDDKLIEALIYLCAANVFAIFQKNELASSLTDRGLLLMPNKQ